MMGKKGDDQKEQEWKNCKEVTKGIEQIRRGRMRRGVQRTEKPDGVRGGAEEKSTDKEEGENR